MESAESSAQRVLAAMERPGTYPHPVERIEHIQTHISHVFLAGGYAYKLKKSVDLGFLDFSSLESRVHFCREELRLNQRLAPEVYLDLWGLVEGPGGPRLTPLDQAGAGLLEPCVRMAEMPQDRLMSRLLARGEVAEADVRALAALLAGFYRRAEAGPHVEEFGRPSAIAFNVEENFRETADYQEVSVAPGRWRAIRDYSLEFLRARRGLFERRVAEGYIKDGHGDLHAGNIVLPAGGPPIVFDCIEFNQRFRFQDVACDLGFLAMDLDFHGRPDLSAALVEEYVAQSGDAGLTEVLGFYKCYRAVVRAKIHGFMLDDMAVPAAQKFQDIDRAKAYWRLAVDYAGGEPPFFCVLMMGLMGAGKSFMARKLGGATGWLQINSDAVRKQLHGMAREQRSYDAWGQGLYGPEATESTYQALLEVVEGRLSMGASVIVDASFADAARRRAFAELAGRHGAVLLAVEVKAADGVVRARLERRQAKAGTVSDGRWELYRRQQRAWQPAGPELKSAWLTIDGGAEEGEKLAALMKRLKDMGHVPEA